MKERGLEMPSILRIENLLDDRIESLNQAFAKAINKANYQNEYRGVFPIKVNQQCHVIEEIASFGQSFHHGFEAGSKAELLNPYMDSTCLATAFTKRLDAHVYTVFN